MFGGMAAVILKLSLVKSMLLCGIPRARVGIFLWNQMQRGLKMFKEKKLDLSAAELQVIAAVEILVEKKFEVMQKIAADLEREKVFALNLDRRLQKLEGDE